MEKEAILERWTEYISELFSDERGEMPTIINDTVGPKTLKSEVQSAINKMGKNKA